jgi:hypothetical protein
VLHRRFNCLVRSVVLLLRRAADGPAMNGRYALKFRDEPVAYNTFHFRIVRLWELPAEQLLTGGIGILPLAPLADDAVKALPRVIETIDRRLKEAPKKQADQLRAATTVLMGLRHSDDIIQRVLQGASAMWEKIYEDSSVVQASMKRAEQKGALAHARAQLLRLGKAKFGLPTAAHRATVNAIAELDRLDALGERLLTVNSWKELLS